MSFKRALMAIGMVLTALGLLGLVQLWRDSPSV